MTEISIIRDNNFIIRTRALKVFVDDEFVDFIEPDERIKKIRLKNPAKRLQIKVDKCASNVIDFDINGSNKFRVTSQIQNGLFVLVYLCFLGGLILNMAGYISPYMGLAMISPMTIIVFWQTFGRKKYLRISSCEQHNNTTIPD